MSHTQPAGTPVTAAQMEAYVRRCLRRLAPATTADTPEPSTPPAQPHAERRAAAGGHPGTLDGPGVLGRAWIDAERNMWWPDGPDWWRIHGGTTDHTAVVLREDYGGREVLLVDPGLIDLLRRWRDGYVDGDGLEYTEVRRHLAAAVDAYDRPTTGGPALDSTANNIQPEAKPAPEPDSALPTADHCLGCNGELIRDGDGRLHHRGGSPLCAVVHYKLDPGELRRRLDLPPAEPAPEPLRRIAEQVAAIVAGHDPGHGPRLSELQAAVRAAGGRLVVEVEPAPEPAGDGPGWDRESINELIRMLRNTGLSTQQYHADQVEALLADRDRWAKVSSKWADETIAARNAADVARAELAEALNDVDDRDTTIGTLRDQLNHQTGAAFDNQAEASRLQAELAEYRDDLQRARELIVTLMDARKAAARLEPTP